MYDIYIYLHWRVAVYDKYGKMVGKYTYMDPDDPARFLFRWMLDRPEVEHLDATMW